MEKFRWAAALALPLWVAACAVSAPPPRVEAPLPPQWQAPLPHGGSAERLGDWWRALQDPALADLIGAAQRDSPTLAVARARVAQARAARQAAAGGLLPTLNGSASVSRGNNQPPLPTSTVVQVGAQAAWEIDVFGRQSATLDAAQARLRAAQAGWHEARVSLAADTAGSYFRLRACQLQLDVAEADAKSRAETARLAQLSTEAGFKAPADTALARASSADAAARLTQQRAQCEIERKTLVALTGLPEPALRERLAQRPPPATPQLFAVSALPARVLAQRPDIYQAELAVAAASAEIGAARADRYPRLQLTGSVAAGQVYAGRGATDAQTWSIGPLALTLPIFDGGRRAANEQAAIARYDEAVAQYRGRVRDAVSEVERALVNLDSTQARAADARTSVAGYRTFFNATQSRYEGGLASLLELEEARRNLLAAETAQVGLYRDLQTAWVSLYRAAGGGWDREAPQP